MMKNDGLDFLEECVRDFDDWEMTTREARRESELARDFYDGDQWTDKEKEELQQRGQADLVKNRIFKKINFLLGMEINARQDPKAVPVTNSHSDDSKAFTDALRFVASNNEFEDIASSTWEHVLIEGYGGCVSEVSPATGGIVIRHVPYDRLWYDVHSRAPDFSDARSKGLSVWMDLEDAIAEYASRPGVAENFEEILREAVNAQRTASGDETHDDQPTWVSTDNQKRKRIRISERYYRQIDDETGKERWFFCAYTRSGFVIPPRPTGYVDEDGLDICPLEMVSCFVKRDGSRFGLVKHMIGPQKEINKRSSKALHLLSVRQLMVEDGAVANVQEARIQLARPDGVLETEPGAVSAGRIQPLPTGDMAQGQFQLLAEAKQEIDMIGPDIPQLGSVSSSASGRSIMMRQQIGSLELSKPMRHFRRWKLNVYKNSWYAVRQFWTEEKWFRVTDDSEKTGYRFVGINRQMSRAQRFQELLSAGSPPQVAVEGAAGNLSQQIMADATNAAQQYAQMMQQQGGQMDGNAMQQVTLSTILQHPLMQQQFTAADVATIKVDIELDESPDTTVLQQEYYEQLAAVMPTIISAKPDLAGVMVEMLIESSQLPTKKRLLEIIRQPPGQEQQQAQQMQQIAAQLQIAGQQADIQKTNADAALSQARAANEQVGAQAKVPMTQAEIKLAEARAASSAADAGAKMADTMANTGMIVQGDMQG